MRALEAVPQADRVAVGIEVAQLLTDALQQRLPHVDVTADRPKAPGEVLTAIGEWRPDGVSVSRAGR